MVNLLLPRQLPRLEDAFVLLVHVVVLVGDDEVWRISTRSGQSSQHIVFKLL